MPRALPSMKQINLWRFLPVGIFLAIGIYLITYQWPYLFGFALVLFVITFMGIQIRLGRLPWFETKDGKKQPFVIWLEDKVPLLRAGFWRR